MQGQLQETVGEWPLGAPPKMVLKIFCRTSTDAFQKGSVLVEEPKVIASPIENNHLALVWRQQKM